MGGDSGADVRRVKRRPYPEWSGLQVGREVIAKMGQAGACGENMLSLGLSQV